ncbi:RNA polymerase sigma factor [Rhizobacter sp. OV335]|uniref:RNA polymerase sigma factor n=1 Tax=Rhizobacter sp. OV335 TaxID=1500264 RepID=UPI000913A8D2|nr:RNA polymerase sigma factor [Rhizobacter sp. OV335]SHM23613.1 RNA polymerase sigma-70 factor, ECF subfamily [Rhizobacter sp. OV335]
MRSEDEAEIVAGIPHLRRYARGLVGDRERADDLVQDTLERACSKFSLWQRRGEVRAWMFGIMHNLFIDRVRSQRSNPEQLVDSELPEQPERPMQADRLELRDLERVLARLPAEQREVLLLVGLEEMSYQDVASAIGVPIGTVMSRLSRARERLRAELEGRTMQSRIQRVK